MKYKPFFQDAGYVDPSSTTRPGGTKTSTKDNKQRLKELEKQYGEYLLRIKTNALSAYIGAVAQILGAPDSPVWQNALVPTRCIGSTVQGNVAHYDLKGPRDVPATIVLTYVQLGEWVDVFWDLQGFKHAAGTARKGFGLNYADNMKNAHLQCEADLARNPATTAQLTGKTPSTQTLGAGKVCPQCAETLPPNAKFCNKCGLKMV